MAPASAGPERYTAGLNFDFSLCLGSLMQPCRRCTSKRKKGPGPGHCLKGRSLHSSAGLGSVIPLLVLAFVATATGEDEGATDNGQDDQCDDCIHGLLWCIALGLVLFPWDDWGFNDAC